MKRNLAAAEASLQEPFKGVTTVGQLIPNLFALEKTFSEGGFETSRNVMRLNETIREITGRDDGTKRPRLRSGVGGFACPRARVADLGRSWKLCGPFQLRRSPAIEHLDCLE
jgi:hypothetical protein